MSELHVFGMDDTDYVVAEDADDAWAVYREHLGEDAPDCEHPFEQMPDDKKVKIAIDDAPTDSGFSSNDGWTKNEKRGVWVSERTFAEWANVSGRGYLGSTEW